MQVAALPNVTQRNRIARGHMHNISLTSIQESLSSPAMIPHLPTPRGTPPPDIPVHTLVISHTLFDLPETILDSDDISPNQIYMAPSRNMLLTIVDQNGVFDHEVVFCVCFNDDIKVDQLLHSGLFPATFKSIKTVFTFSVLDDFLKDNLKCKTTAQQYYSKLQSTTSKMFPNLVLVCYIVLQ
jgi:CxC2 like cysteine cluster associated with KDZ transposases